MTFDEVLSQVQELLRRWPQARFIIDPIETLRAE